MDTYEIEPLSAEMLQKMETMNRKMGSERHTGTPRNRLLNNMLHMAQARHHDDLCQLICTQNIIEYEDNWNCGQLTDI